MAAGTKPTIVGRLRARSIRDLEDLEARGRLGVGPSPLLLGFLTFLTVTTVSLTLHWASSSAFSLPAVTLVLIASFGLAAAVSSAQATSQYRAVRLLDEAQSELLAVHGELELARSSRRALLHDANAVVGAMGAAIHALERSGEQRETGKAISSQLSHLRRLLSAPSSTLRPTSLDHFREPLVSFANLHGISLFIDLPLQVHVMAEPSGVSTILQNLVDNARKYAPESPVRVFWEPAGTQVRICVEDRGPGLSDNPETLFAEGVRGESGSDGFGLGLATARMLAEQNEGALWYEHREGPGSRFVLKLHRAGSADRQGGTL